MNAVTGTLLAKAYNGNDISLCAPFNAALPVFQLVVSTVLQDETQLPPRKISGVFVVTGSAFWLARAGRKSHAPLLPPGATLVLTCCAIWSLTTKFDQMATSAAASPAVHVTFSKLLTGLWAAFGASLLAGSTQGGDSGKGAGRGASSRALNLLRARPSLALLVFGIAATEAFYMGCYFAAITRVSKVYVVAIKKGGNLLVSSVGGWLLFGEPHEGRVVPVLGVVAGVMLMTV